MVIIYTVSIICTVYIIYTVPTVCTVRITKYAVYCELIIKCAVCRSLLANAVNLLRNARFVRIAKDYIRPPRSYGSRQFAANRNNQPKKKNPDGSKVQSTSTSIIRLGI